MKLTHTVPAVLLTALSCGTLFAADILIRYQAARVYPSLIALQQLQVASNDALPLPLDKARYLLDINNTNVDPKIFEDIIPTQVDYVKNARTLPGTTTTSHNLDLVLDSTHVPVSVSGTGTVDAADLAAAVTTALSVAKDPMLKRVTATARDGVLTIVPPSDVKPTHVELLEVRSHKDTDLLKDKALGLKADLTLVYLRLSRASVRTGDKLKLTVKADLGQKDRTSDVSTATVVQDFSFSLTPSFVQTETLNNGKKRPVGQLAVSFDELTLTPSRTAARTYLKTNSTISTDAKDNQSNVNVAFGVQRSIARSWYIPVHAETKVLGDQVANNVSSVTSGGLTTILPWQWTRSLFSTRLFSAPVSPEFTFDGQFERRFRQDRASEQQFRDKNAFRLFGDCSWKPIRLLPGDGSGDSVTLEIQGKGWYIPRQHKATGQIFNRMEGLLQVSVLVPVTKLSPNGSGFMSDTKGTKSHIRIQYSHGANEANGFKHSSTLTIGIEVTDTKSGN